MKISNLAEGIPSIRNYKKNTYMKMRHWPYKVQNRELSKMRNFFLVFLRWLYSQLPRAPLRICYLNQHPAQSDKGIFPILRSYALPLLPTLIFTRASGRNQQCASCLPKGDGRQKKSLMTEGQKKFDDYKYFSHPARFHDFFAVYNPCLQFKHGLKFILSNKKYKIISSATIIRRL